MIFLPFDLEYQHSEALNNLVRLNSTVDKHIPVNIYPCDEAENTIFKNVCIFFN